MKLASFDLEISKEITNFERWKDHAPLGISCAAVAFSDNEEIQIWENSKNLDKEQCCNIVYCLLEIVKQGYSILTWNGTGFDFQVLAQASGLKNECGELALNHIDMMLLVTFQKGWLLSLEKALNGACLSGKLKNVTLKDGTILKYMDGSKVPSLWKNGEKDAVLAYLREDVAQPIKLAKDILRCGYIRWITERGNLMEVKTDLKIVKQCFRIREPDTSWMSSPPKREDFVSWIPNYKKKLN
jgi:hypothetical protein